MCFRDLNLQNINRVHGQLTVIKGGNEVYSARPWGLQSSLPLSTFISQNLTGGKGGHKGGMWGNLKVNVMGLILPPGRACCALQVASRSHGFQLFSQKTCGLARAAEWRPSAGLRAARTPGESSNPFLIISLKLWSLLGLNLQWNSLG